MQFEEMNPLISVSTGKGGENFAEERVEYECACKRERGKKNRIGQI